MVAGLTFNSEPKLRGSAAMMEIVRICAQTDEPIPGANYIARMHRGDSLMDAGNTDPEVQGPSKESSRSLGEFQHKQLRYARCRSGYRARSSFPFHTERKKERALLYKTTKSLRAV